LTGQANNNDSQAAGGNAGSVGAFHPVEDSPLPPAQHGDDMHRGWVKSWRCSIDHEVSKDANAFLLMHHLLWEARREPKANRRLGVVVERGQCDLTQHQLAERSGMTRKQIRAALGRLVRYGTIRISYTKGQGRGRIHSIVTIANYERYQAASDPGAKEPSMGGPAKGHKRASPLEGKKGEKVENTTIGPDAASPVPAELVGLQLYAGDKRLCKAWPELKTALEQACPGVDVMAEVRKAHAWEVGNPSKRKKARARFLTSWCTQAQDRGGNGRYRQQGARHFSAAEQDKADYEGR
jgi:hypothetical protein